MDPHLQEDLAKRNAELETLLAAKERELEIEAALERVRSASMAMHSSNDLHNVIRVLTDQLSVLGFHFHTANFITNDSMPDWEIWISSPGVTGVPPRIHVPHINHILFNQRNDAIAAGKEFLTASLNKEEKDIFFHYLFENTAARVTPQERKEWVYQQKGMGLTTVLMKNISLTVINYDGMLYTAAENEVIKRFTSVFEQSYTRFLDLQKAEAQTREAEIQLALERLRARTMAMHQSTELAEAASLMFEQLSQLGAVVWTCGFAICNRNSEIVEKWMSTPDGKMMDVLHIPYTLDRYERRAYETWENGDDIYTEITEGIELQKALEQLMAHSSMQTAKNHIIEAGIRLPTWVKGHFVSFKYGYLLIVTTQPFEETSIFIRFAKVFDQTYTRFLDLQKAEAQARESQIQLALERVRARTMAMQKSEELADVAELLFKQVNHLGIKAWTTGFNVWNEDDNFYTDYVTNPQGGFMPPYNVDTRQVPVLIEVSNAKKRGDEFYVNYEEGEQLAETYHQLSKFGERQYKSILDSGFEFPSHQYEHFVFGSKVSLLFITYEPVPEAHDIFKRFANVFEQTYTRFLDLQKAEAQAREAQIQLALERVRARTMAMQKSDELPEAANLLFHQVQSLGMPAWSAGYCTWGEDKKVITAWMSSEGVLQPPFKAPTTEDPSFIHMREASERGENFFVDEIGGEELVKHYQYMRTLPVVGEILDSIIEAGHPLPTFQIFHLAYFSQGFLLFITYEPVPGAHEIFKRFAIVFDQTYTRFLDLQKAEAQAREAQIQLSLERVRARAMAMHRSDELSEVLTVLFEQYDVLEVDPVYVDLSIIDPASNTFTWRCTGKAGQRVIAEQVVDLNSMDVWKDAVEKWIAGDTHEVVTLFFPKEVLPRVFELFSEIRAKIPKDAIFTDKDFPDGLYTTQGFCKFGALGFGHSRKPTEEEKAIVAKFAIEFERLYQRFLDLQKAEAQAREAQIEAALERVRSRTTGMQKSEELREVIQLVFEQLRQLDFNIDSAHFNLNYKESDDYNLWSAAPGQPYPVETHIPYFDHPVFIKAREAKEKGLDFFTESYTQAEKNKFFEHLFKYIPAISPERRQYILDGQGVAASTVLMNTISLWVMNYAGIPYSEAENAILKRFGKVFEQSHTRFLDLQKSEEQARESQIQLALERVRARTMAMQHSEELSDTSFVLFQQLKELGETGEQISIGIFNEEERMLELFATIRGNQWQRPAKPGLDKQPVMTAIYSAWKDQKKSLVVDLTGEALRDYNKFRMEANLGLYNSETEFDQDRWVINVAFFSKGMLSFSSHDPRPRETIRLLERFAGVFDLTYTRFLDLKQAEARAREAQIEAALERIRSHSMAMHQSGDLHDVIKVVTEQLLGLGIKFNVANFARIFSEGSWDLWISTPEQAYPALVHVPYIDHRLFNNVMEAVAQGRDFVTDVYDQEEKNIFFKHFFENTLAKNTPEERKEFVMNCKGFARSLFLTKNIWLAVSNYDGIPFSNEENAIFKRFANAFEQSYTRFLDLQKAEAQAREANIEAALERLRSRSLAMHKSSELSVIARTMFDQLRGLGLELEDGLIIMLFKEGSHDQLHWPVFEGIETDDTMFTVPYFDHPVMNEVYKARDAGVKFIERHFDKSIKDDFLEKIFSITDYKVLPVEVQQKNFAGTCYHYSFAMEKFTGILMHSYNRENYPTEYNDILKRFARVFEQAYVRFLDLQKAEANAREAQIEAALEKVRSRSLAMRKSDEMQDVVHALFERLKELNVDFYTVIIIIFQQGSKDIIWWLENKEQQQYPKILLPYSDNPYLKDLFETRETRKEFFSRSYPFAEKNEIFNYLFADTDFKYVPEKQKKFLLESEFATMSVALAKKTAIHITSYARKSFSEEENEILKRFAKVFDQAYTRFLDLQKAEAQAREAQIEAALERVRSKVMAMRNSEDLNETIKVFYYQLESLNLTPRRCGVGLLNKENHTAELFTMNTSTEGQSVELIGKLDMTMHPILEGVYNGWLKQEEYHPVLRGYEINEYYKILRPQIQFPDYPDDAVQYGYFFFFDEGGVYAWTEKQMEEAELQIYRRFTSVLNLTYKRYKDLKQAEANAKEAVKQAALDRIRADIASMRSVSDLDRITPLIWNELTILGIPFIRCGVFIMDDVQQLIHTFLSAPDGRAIAAFHLPYDTPGNLGKVLSHWKKNKSYIDHWGENEFMNLTDILVKQGSIANREEYLSSLPHGGLFLHFLPFLQGMLYVGNTTLLGEEEIKLLQSVADAFSTAYARYEDFNKLEAAKKQVDSTLNELQATQRQLIQSEKMASLGELTAGIAHEIQNPLNFVNNFSEVSNELVDEMTTEFLKGNANEALGIATDLKDNLEKISHHGKRADAIVKGMLQHSKTSTGQKEPTDINMLCDEYLRLSYHGLRAKDKSFNATMKTDFDESIGKINMVPQDIGRVLLNLFNNAFYATNQKQKDLTGSSNLSGQPPYVPTVSVVTKRLSDKIEITVSDNGNGIPQNIVDKIFQPFFTTKPTGQGTGLGLSLAYDIIKAHGGEIKVETEEGEGSTFIIRLPYNP